jgi:hypothetical protein
MQETKQLITDSKNIYLIPGQEPEAITATLALFYTLKNSGKNVNIVVENLPENLKFLSPSLDFISYPKNFVISIPTKVAGVSQIYYEKSDEALKIYLTIENGNIKKENIAFYFSETKPDLIITVGVQDYSKELEGKLNSFGFLLDSPILNIDSSASLTTGKQENQKFGRINIIEDMPLAEVIDKLGEATSKEAANCLLTGLVIYTNNFRTNVTSEIFESAGKFMKMGADLKVITENLKI